NNTSYGGIAAYNNFVFVTDMSTAIDPTGGIIRFDLNGGPTAEFATNNSYIDVVLGLDGLLYGVVGPSIHVFNPQTMTEVRNFTVPLDVRAIAVSNQGDIFAAD